MTPMDALAEKIDDLYTDGNYDGARAAVRDLRARAHAEGLEAGLRQAAERCDALSGGMMGKGYGKLGTAYNDAAAEIRSMIPETASMGGKEE